MRHVFGKSTILFLSTIFLSGCKDTEVSVASLGKKLSAPVLTSANPFSQNFNTQKYAQLKGVCDSRVGNISLSFDNINWTQPPSTPDITGTALAGGTTNDISCSDGVFDIYITESDLVNSFHIANTTNISSVYIKGETLIGDTETVSFIKPTPKKIILKKEYPRGFAGSGQCEKFKVYLTDEYGNPVDATSDVAFSLESNFNGSISTNIPIYLNDLDCVSDTGHISFLTYAIIPANNQSIDVFYKFPADPIYFNQQLKFKITGVVTPAPETQYIQVTLRDSDYLNSTHRWLSIDNFYPQIYKNTCYPLTVYAHKYDHGDSIDSGSINPTSNDPNLKFYDSINCSAETPSYTGGSTYTIYVKYSTAVESLTTIPVSISLSGSLLGGAIPYDFSPIGTSIDVSNKSTATRLDLKGPFNLKGDVCSSKPYSLIAVNDNGTPIPQSTAKTINLANQEIGVGTFYSDYNCSGGNEIVNTSIGDTAYGTFYFKPNSPTNSENHFKFTSTEFPDLIRSWFYNP